MKQKFDVRMVFLLKTAESPCLGRSLFIHFILQALPELLSVYVYFSPFGFEGGVWELIAFVFLVIAFLI